MSLKTVGLYLAEMPQEDKVVCKAICRDLGRAGARMVREWYRACDEVAPGEKIPWGEVQTRGVVVGKATVQEAGLRPELANEMQRTEFFARFKTEFGKILRGEKASLPFPGDAPFIYLRLDPGNAAATIEKREGVWYLRDPHFYPGGGRNQDNKREWRLKGRSRDGWEYRWLEAAEKLACVRIKPDHKKRGAWVALITLHVPQVDDRPGSPEAVWAGVDLGLNSPAVLSIPDHPEGGFVRFFGRDLYLRMWDRLDQYEERKARLNRAGKRRAARDLRAKITGIRQHINELISREIVDLCRRLRVTGIRMEDLRGIQDAATGKLKHWPRYHLMMRIQQKAGEAGLAFELVRAAGTSQTCSACGYREKGNREGALFHCLRCGFERHADVNAANNIARGMEEFDLPTGAQAMRPARRLELVAG